MNIIYLIDTLIASYFLYIKSYIILLPIYLPNMVITLHTL